jgi:hypothetical protein
MYCFLERGSIPTQCKISAINLYYFNKQWIVRQIKFKPQIHVSSDTYAFNLPSNVLWFRTSYAFVRSRSIPSTCRCSSLAYWILSMKDWLDVSVDFIFLNPFSASYKILCVFTKDINVL